MARRFLMPHYRVAMRVLDLLVTEVEADNEDEARKVALFALAELCAMEEEATVKIEAVAEMVEVD